MPRITVQTLVKNEQRFIWFALRSVVEWVDEILVWDTGSSDQTVEIIKTLHYPNIKFRSIASVDAASHTQARQQMLDATTSDWFITLDGDEVWWRDSIAQLIEAIHSHPNASAIISPFYNAVGDIWHYQDPTFIKYQIHNYKGGYNIRAINRRVAGLHITNPHGRQEYRTLNQTPLQELPKDQLPFVDASYLHMTHLRRSTSSMDKATLKRAFKFRFDLGRPSPATIFPPEAFYYPRPEIVGDPFAHRTLGYELISFPVGILRKLKSELFPLQSHGY